MRQGRNFKTRGKPKSSTAQTCEGSSCVVSRILSIAPIDSFSTFAFPQNRILAPHGKRLHVICRLHFHLPAVNESSNGTLTYATYYSYPQVRGPREPLAPSLALPPAQSVSLLRAEFATGAKLGRCTGVTEETNSRPPIAEVEAFSLSPRLSPLRLCCRTDNVIVTETERIAFCWAPATVELSQQLAKTGG